MKIVGMKVFKNILIYTSIVLVLSSGTSQKGTVFPEISCKNLNDEVIVLPKSCKGKYTLIGMAYSKKSEEDLKSWFKPVFYKFIYKPDKNALFQDSYDINLYFIPMFTGMQQLGSGTVVNSMKQEVDKKLHPYILLYKGELKKYKDLLDFEKKDVPYFFVLDPSGKIIYATSGAYSDVKMGQVEDLITDALE